MRPHFQRVGLWLLAWALLALGGASLLARQALVQQHDAFDTDARIAHRLLSQRVVQHDAILATLALLAVPGDGSHPEQRLPTVYPQILSVQRRDGDAPWPDARLQALDAESRRLGRAVLAEVDLSQGRYQLLLGAQPSSYLVHIDVLRMVPWNGWPMPPDSSPVRLTLAYAGQTQVLQPGTTEGATDWAWNFSAQKRLAADSQPLEMRAERRLGWAELPWTAMGVWAALSAALLKAAHILVRQRQDRLRAEALLRLGQVTRLNTLGELAAGLAHELNQPLTAILANTQAAQRLLREDTPDLPPIRQALSQAVGQARRAAEVVGRLRRMVEQPQAASPVHALALQDVARKALYLLEPECQRRHLAPIVEAPSAPLLVYAEPVALEQIVHNLLMNALQAMEHTPVAERALTVRLSSAKGQGCLAVQDSGPGIPAEVLPRIFEPFFTTREGGLGLGLSLCETLAGGMGGALRAQNHAPHGAAFTLSLPLAQPTSSSP
ncbi:MAG: ATP-binding protein [Rhodoferax sp.]|nr:ATP-binding protein [Rhodoferax sp.]MDP3653213.1 ATP-binding protein [Rhodoferax sp.]